jgi:hypothetical protein
LSWRKSNKIAIQNKGYIEDGKLSKLIKSENEEHRIKGMVWFDLLIALRPQTPKHIKGGWSNYTDTSELINGNVGQDMVSVRVSNQ